MIVKPPEMVIDTASTLLWFNDDMTVRYIGNRRTKKLAYRIAISQNISRYMMRGIGIFRLDAVDEITGFLIGKNGGTGGNKARIYNDDFPLCKLFRDWIPDCHF